MDVVSPELNSLLPDEIMDTEVMEDMPHSQSDGTTVQSKASYDTSVPMETDAPSESLRLCSDTTSAEKAVVTPASKDSTIRSSSGNQVPISISNTSSTLLTFKPSLATSTATTKTTDSVTGTAVSTSGLQKLTTPFTISAANHQIILNKVASSQATEAAKSAVTTHQGQKLLVTAIGKSGQPIVLQLPHTGKAAVAQGSGEPKTQTPQFKVVTIGGRPELKPVVGGTNQLTTLQTQQLKTVQVTLVILHYYNTFSFVGLGMEQWLYILTT